MRRRKRTKQKDRLQQYSDLAWQLRMATRICLSQELAVKTVDEIVDLHRKFEHEDDPGGEWN